MKWSVVESLSNRILAAGIAIVLVWAVSCEPAGSDSNASKSGAQKLGHYPKPGLVSESI